MKKVWDLLGGLDGKNVTLCKFNVTVGEGSACGAVSGQKPDLLLFEVASLKAAFHSLPPYMIDTDAHTIPLDWLVEDAVSKADVDYAEHVSRMVSLFYLKQEHPDVHDLLMDMEKRVKVRGMQPQQIGQLVGKQDNNYLMTNGQMEGLLKLLLPKLTSDHD